MTESSGERANLARALGCGALVCLGWAVLVWIGGAIVITQRRDDRTPDPRFTGARAAGRPSSSARPGQRWTFQLSSLYGGPSGVETWDVVAVTSHTVTTAVTSPAGPATTTSWSFALRHEAQGAVYRVGPATIVVPGTEPILCDIVEYTEPSMGDLMRAWVAVGREGELEFPGVVRETRLEGRGRLAVEWELLAVTRPKD